MASHLVLGAPCQHAFHRLVRRSAQRRRASVAPERGVRIHYVHLVPRRLHATSLRSDRALLAR